MPTQYLSAEGNTGECGNASMRWTLRGLRPLHAWKLRAREPGDPVNAREVKRRAGWRRCMNQKSSMNVGGESDGREVPAKSLNKDGRSSAEGSEGR